MIDDVAAARKRIDTIFQRILQTSNVNKEALDEAMEEFSLILEELNKALEELRINNEALGQARYQLEKEHLRFQDLFTHAPDAYIETDTRGIILQANEVASILFNLPPQQLINKSIGDFVAENDQDSFFELLDQPKSGSGQELTMWQRNRQPFTASFSLMPVMGKRGAPARIRWLIRDVTANKKEQAALSASEERFRTIFTHSHLGMVLTDLSGRIVESNLAFERMVAYINEELKGLEIDGLVDPKDREDASLVRADILVNDLTSRMSEIRYLTKHEQEVWARQTISTLPDMNGEPVYFVYLVENITAQRQSDAELAEMKRRMIESIETERLHLAQELHDGPIQDLYGAVFKLTESPSSKDGEQDNIKETQDLIKQVAGTLRVICGDLRPPTLSNFGLDRAIEAHVEQILEQNKRVQITLNADRDDRLLSQGMRLAMFRIYQQSIANALRHSQATRIMVRLEIGEEEVGLHVEDNGVGFEPPSRMVDLVRSGHYGLAGISERVESLNGSLIIDSSPGNGTRVTVEIPRLSIGAEL